MAMTTAAKTSGSRGVAWYTMKASTRLARIPRSTPAAVTRGEGWIVARVQPDEGELKCGQAVEGAVAIAQVEIVGIRLEAGIDPVPRSPEALRLRHVQRAQDQGIHEPEDHGVCANGQRQRHDGNRGEAGRLAQHAQPEADVLREILDHQQSSLGSIVLFRRLHTPELQHGLAPCLIRRQTGAHVVGRLQSEMFLDLFPQSFLTCPPCRRVDQAGEEPSQGPHDRSSALASKNRPMIAAVCSQSRVSACNCLRPSRVSR